jgi:hypothetical protein
MINRPGSRKSGQENVAPEKGTFKERKGPMGTSIVGKFVTALLLASLIGGFSAAPAVADNYNRKPAPQHRGYYDRGYDRHDYYYYHGRRVYRPRGYYRPGPAYGPPPVYAVPVPPPGISIFLPFPFDLR